MVGRASLLAFVAATGVVQCLPELPTARVWGLLLAVTLMLGALILYIHKRRGQGRRAMLATLPLLAFMAGLALTAVRAELRLADELDATNENKVSRVVLRVGSLPQHTPTSRRFEAEVLSSIPDGVPSRVFVSWNAPGYSGPYGKADRPADFPDLIPGQVWRMALTLKKPHGTRNPHGFDYEGYVFARGLRAVGSVRGSPKLLDVQAWSSLHVLAERARHYTREAMLPYLADKRYGAVLLALAIGDQASVAAGDWEIFNATGITHLVSISGSHITMIAAMGGLATLWLWRRLNWQNRGLAEKLPAQVAACLAALLVAWLYCLLAGWGVPARRTFLMLTVAACAQIMRLSLNASRLICIVAFVVVLLDPWALLASGFWLSFAAVCVLLTSAGWWGRNVSAFDDDAAHGERDMQKWSRNGWQGAKQAAHLQVAITAGLMPILAYIFHEVSVISPVANAYAIPVISLIVTPLALLLAATAFFPHAEWLAGAFAWLGHGALALMMEPTVWLAGLPLASFDTAATSFWMTAIALLGLAVAVLPHGLPLRHFAWLMMVPALMWRPARPPLGAWDLIALDVGQAGGVVISTKNHDFLFDSGLRSAPDIDGGSRIIVPFVRAAGIRSLDVLIVSHADLDHVGGVRSVLEALPVEQSFSSFDLNAHVAREAGLLGLPGQLPRLPRAVSFCEYGVSWKIDGVAFEFVWPLKQTPPRRTAKSSRERNDQSCVLKVRGAQHTALLTGDISAAQEGRLVERGIGRADVVMAAHHGSKTSSSRSFVEATGADHVIAQVGASNRYGHPHRQVERRWERAGASFWRTDKHGAIHVRSRVDGLTVDAERRRSGRYWQGR